MSHYDFANILFSGHCNLRCPYCIGHSSTLQAMPNNLKTFPLNGLDLFIAELNKFDVTQVSLTGTNTDPQLYTYAPELITRLREQIPGVKLSLHTNGQMALKKIESFNCYDRATISMPSFQSHTYRIMTGGASMPDLPKIISKARIPLKISTIVTHQNYDEIPGIITRCRKLRISRMVLRKQYGDPQNWALLSKYRPARYFGENPVYDIDGMEVTVWDFNTSTVRCLNLFSDGTISTKYQLTRR